jgi:DNA-directed RNA polymerase alpha subunit
VSRDVREVPLAGLGLPARPHNALIRNDIRTVGDLLACSEDDLRDMRAMGAASVNEVHLALEAVGLRLAPNYADRGVS